MDTLGPLGLLAVLVLPLSLGVFPRETRAFLVGLAILAGSLLALGLIALGLLGVNAWVEALPYDARLVFCVAIVLSVLCRQCRCRQGA
jgi:hypothetical protein